MNSIKIIYCSKCGWLPRSTWMAQELLTAFSESLAELILVPSSGGIFEIYVNNNMIWSRKVNDGFPDIKKLKQIVRDVIDPTMDLGHTDR